MEPTGDFVQVRLEDTESSSINLRDYLLILLKRRWIILTILFLSIVSTFFYCLQQTPLYRSRTTLYFENRGLEFLSGLTPVVPNKLGESFLNSQITILRSKALALVVVQQLNLSMEDLSSKGIQRKAENKAAENDKNEIATELLGMLQVTPVPDTNLIYITFLSPNPELSATLANSWADEFKRYSGTSDFEMTQKAEGLLAGEVKTLQADIAQKQKLLQDYAARKDVFKLKGDISIGEEHLRSLNNSLTELTKNRIDKAVRLQEIESRPKDSLPEISNNSLINSLKAELARMQRTYSDKLSTYKSDYPEMSRLRNQMDQLSDRIQQETDATFKRAFLAARADFNEALARENNLKQQIESLRRQAAEGYQKEIDYDQLRQEIENKKLLLNSLLQKRNQAGVSAQVQEKMPTIIKIIERAETPRSRHSPDVGKLMLLSVLFGLGGGIGFALILEFMDRSLKSPEDVEKHIQLPLLGVVPQFVPGLDRHQRPALLPPTVKEQPNLPDRKRADLFAMEDSQSVTSEALKTLRTSLLLSFPSGPPRSILITSSRPGEGKTFTASNLAVTLSQLNKRVVLVDADLRNPRIHRVWGLENKNGLTNFLTSQSPIETVIQQSTDSRISVITSGSKSPRPAELLASSRFEEMLLELQKQFDHIIIDSPPLLPVTDSVLLGAKCNTVLLVIRGGETPRDVILQAKKKLMKGNPVIAGAVLNCINLQDPYYYYSYYSYYKEYYGEQVAKTPPAVQ